jgi:SagB-type dehydrogenase family enzyme
MINDARLGTLAENYHIESRNSSAMKHAFKTYLTNYSPDIEKLAKEAPLHIGEGSHVKLPKITSTHHSMLLIDAIANRASSRDFAPEPLSSEQLSLLLYYGNAVRKVNVTGEEIRYQRNFPNSGNLGSVEVFPVILNVEGIEPGIYHFDSISHNLFQIRRGLYSSWLKDKVFFQLQYSEASVAFVLTSAIGRLTAKYGPRGYRLAMLDAGHVSQNYNLMATSLNLNVCTTAGFIDDELDLAIGLDGLEVAAVLVVLVGPKRI